MVGFTIKKHFEAPPERVFEVCTDLRNAARHINGIKKLEVLGDGPIGVGTRFRETRVMFKRECTEEMEIVSFDPPKGYAIGCESHGCRYRTDLRVTASGATATSVASKRLSTTAFACHPRSTTGRSTSTSSSLTSTRRSTSRRRPARGRPR